MTAATVSGPAVSAASAARRRRRIPYLLLLPGMAWLLLFFFLPLAQLVVTSLEEGSLEAGLQRGIGGPRPPVGPKRARPLPLAP